MEPGAVNMAATVYLVEDSKIIRRLLTEALEESGAEVVGCTDSAHAAIEAIALQRPDAVIVDVMLREGAPYEVKEGRGGQAVSRVVDRHDQRSKAVDDQPGQPVGGTGRQAHAIGAARVV